MDDKMGHEQCVAFGKSLKRFGEILQTARSGSETAAIISEVLKIMRGFKVMGRAYADQLVKKVQEVRILQKEKQLLECKVEQLSSMVSGKPTVLKDTSNVDLSNAVRTEEQAKFQGKLKDGTVLVSLHFKCEEDLNKREVELAKLREAYTARTFDLQECRKEVLKLGLRLKNAESQAASKEKESLDEILKLKIDILNLKEETTEVRKGAGRLEEQLGKATVRNEQFVELLKKDSKHHDELRRQQKNLKGYLQLLASKYSSTCESENLQLELRSLECRGLDEDTTSYLKTILERGIKPARCSVETQTSFIPVSQSSISTQTWYSTATEGTQTNFIDDPSALQPYNTSAKGTQTALNQNPSALDLDLPAFQGDVDHDVFHDQWALNFGPVSNIEAKSPLYVREDVAVTEDLWHKVDQEKCLDQVGSKRPIEVIDLVSDSEDESENGQDAFQHKYRKLSQGLERLGNVLDINVPFCEPSSQAISMGKKQDSRPLHMREEFALRESFGGFYGNSISF
ncbi:hypothetical protein MPTK1_4g12370 [Marchantia polymorpha subsp. ruderalis]|uniref:Uncharacterized protein n=2 Tax=Marchantia polymorpha TaxID=3197 RepID=A0AAF6B953_MARPO|nr:hypothetical protein MARPO_0011s0219 [Marchantia polymorpha]BBN08537.1 hypothetical protein Mp_4g12370 [Marchantia polymorpha subsp. ruderalis]|eukprot:PTQ46571.1 hypothetical protein MARPO_0011s0219 [Marchantia polymorpha]